MTSTTARMIATLPPLTAVRCESPDARIESSRLADCSDSSPTDRPATSAAASGPTPASDVRSPSRIDDAAASIGPGDRRIAIPDSERIVSTAARSVFAAGPSLPDIAISVPGAGTRSGLSTRMLIGRSTSTRSPRAEIALVAIRTSVEDEDCHTAAEPLALVIGSPLTTAMTSAEARAFAQPATGSAVVAQTWAPAEQAPSMRPKAAESSAGRHAIGSRMAEARRARAPAHTDPAMAIAWPCRSTGSPTNAAPTMTTTAANHAVAAGRSSRASITHAPAASTAPGSNPRCPRPLRVRRCCERNRSWFASRRCAGRVPDQPRAATRTHPHSRS